MRKQASNFHQSQIKKMLKYSLIFFFLLSILSCTSNSTKEKKDTAGKKDSLMENNLHKTEKEAKDSAQIVKEITLFPAFEAYLKDPDTNAFTNLRLSPGGKIGRQIDNRKDYIFTFDAGYEGWFRISAIIGIEEEIAYEEKSLWIHHSVIAVGTRNYGGQELPLFTHPTKKSEIIYHINQERELRFDTIITHYVHVYFFDEKGNKISGWIEAENLCGNPVTNCC
jgi:hypothetical protein